jgi:hypothetical protein
MKDYISYHLFIALPLCKEYSLIYSIEVDAIWNLKFDFDEPIATSELLSFGGSTLTD